MDLALIEGTEVISKYFFVNFCNRTQNVNLIGYLVIQKNNFKEENLFKSSGSNKKQTYFGNPIALDLYVFNSYSIATYASFH